MKRALWLATFLLASALLADDGALQIANIGDLTLDSGESIRDCRIGYRTYGQLAPDRSNALVLTTWFAGTSAGLAAWTGPGRLFDSSRYFVIAIDALGDGVSSSPSNSSSQPAARFPRFTIRDMVRSQYTLLTRELKLDHVYAVAGLSMGGMQSLQWAVAYPDYMSRVISIVGTPKQTSYDLMLWKSELSVLESMGGTPDGASRAMNTVADIQGMGLWTPAYIAEHTKPDSVDAAIQTHRDALRKIDPYDYASQLRAMIAQDIYRDFGGSPETAANAIRAKLFIAVSLQDHMVQPAPARELARLTKAESMTMTSDCGHLATGCERETLEREVKRFLAAK
jgi:homoserine O-acetyltransferase/O-succinyltransferase